MRRRSILSPVFMTLVLLFMYLPVLTVVLYSFNSSTARVASSFEGFSLQWYEKLFADASGYGSALTTSLQVAGLSVLFACVLGTLGALGLARRSAAKNLREKAENAALTFGEQLATLPIMIPEIVLGIAFMAVFLALKIPFGLITLVLAHTTFCVPYVCILVKTRLSAMDESLTEAARDLGATPLRAFFTVTFPLILPGVLSGALLSLAMSLDDFVISFFVNGAETTTLPIKVYSSIKVGVSPQVNALCTLMLGAVFVAVALGQAVLRGRSRRRGE